MLSKYVFALVLGPAAGLAASGSVFAGYAGTWLVKFAGGNAMIYQLRAEGAGLGGFVLQPKDLSYDSDGYFTRISAEHEEVPVTDAALAGNCAEFTFDGDRYRMKLLDADHATVVALAVAGQVPPWKLVRATAHDELALSGAWPRPGEPAPAIAEVIREIDEMASRDEAAHAPGTSVEETEAMDQTDRAGLEQIHQRYGWPAVSLVGKQAAHEYFLLLQHQDLDLQREVLPDMERAARQGEASGRDYIHLADAVMVREGKPQHWGTQAHCDNGQAVLDPVDDPAGLPDRRAANFLGPVAQQIKALEPYCSTAAAKR
ncbi:MAG: DUF6624 domain-containing protein [Bryobacteraceae bacterium]